MHEASVGAARPIPSVFRAYPALVTLALLEGLLVSCGGAPEVIEPKPKSPGAVTEARAAESSPQAARAEAAPAKETEAVASKGSRKAPRSGVSPEGRRDKLGAGDERHGDQSRPSDSVLYNLTDAADLGSSTAEARHAPEARPLESWPDGSLVSELEGRWSRQWSSLSGGIGQAGTGPDPRREELARKLLAIGFLRSSGGDPPQIFEEALTYARATLREPQHKLMAAAFLESEGRREEALHLVVEVSGGLGAAGGAAPPAERFALENLAFARSIEGPGKYSAAEAGEVGAGKSVLVYGEFRNFRSVLDSRGEPPVHHRAFAASLKLLRDSGEEIDRLDFLPEGRGYQAASDPGAIVNFWARYRFPASLDSGKYKVVVEGKDLLAGARAVSEIALEIP